MPGLRQLGVALLLGLCCLLAYAQQPVPNLTGHVVDTTGVLSTAERDRLEARLSAFEQTSGSQLVLLMVAATAPQDIASYANQVANHWKIGRQDVGDGLLLVVALQERKLRFEVAKSLEGAIPDLAAKRIIDQAISPLFRQGQYAAGIEAGFEQAMALIRGEALPPPVQPPRHAAGGFDWMELAALMFMAVPILGTVFRNLLGSRLGAMATGGVAGTVAMWVTSSLLLAALAGLAGAVFALISASTRTRQLGWYGGSSSWGSGGHGSSHIGSGFSSGGGGDFGGGGASGDW